MLRPSQRFVQGSKAQWTILIPCIHPGMDMHHSHHLSARQVLEMTMWIVLLTISITGEELARASTQPRQQVLNDIVSRVNDRLEKTGIAAELEQTKAELIMSLRTARSRRKEHFETPIEDRYEGVRRPRNGNRGTYILTLKTTLSLMNERGGC